MNGKKTTIMEGVLMSPLALGRRALVFTQGRLMRTSTVVAIHDISDEQIHFETMNTNYTLLGSPSPQTACDPMPAMLAA